MMEMLFDLCPYQFSFENKEKFQKALQERTYLDWIVINPERLQNYFAGGPASVLCCIALKCLHQEPSRRPCIDWLKVTLASLHNDLFKWDEASPNELVIASYRLDLKDWFKRGWFFRD